MFWATRSLIHAAYSGSLVPVFGAGVVRGLRVPLWESLLKKIAERHHVPEATALESDLTLLYDLLLFDPDPEVDVISSLRAALYDESRASDEAWPALLNVDRDLDEKAEPIKALSELLMALARLSPNRDIHAITYNVDTLVEEYLSHLGVPAVALHLGGGLEFASRSSGADRQWEVEVRTLGEMKPGRFLTPPKQVRIFHAHGLVPRPDKGRPKNLVFGRSDYRRALGANDCRTAIQLEAFRSSTCLFYGFSFQDSNVEQLLRTARTQQHAHSMGPRHFCLLATEGDKSHLREPVSKDELGGRLKLDSLKTRRLLDLGVVRLGTYSFRQQVRFLEDLTATLSRA